MGQQQSAEHAHGTAAAGADEGHSPHLTCMPLPPDVRPPLTSPDADTRCCPPAVPTDAGAATPAAVAELRSNVATTRCRGLLNLAHAGRRRRGDAGWGRAWIDAGAVRAIVDGTAAAAPHEVPGQVAAASPDGGELKDIRSDIQD